MEEEKKMDKIEIVDIKKNPMTKIVAWTIGSILLICGLGLCLSSCSVAHSVELHLLKDLTKVFQTADDIAADALKSDDGVPVVSANPQK